MRDEDDSFEDELPSKSQLKRESHAIQKLGLQLSELNEVQLAAIPLPENVLDAVKELKNTRSHIARKRQMQFVGKLMRSIDLEDVEHAYQLTQQTSDEAKALHKLTERWRDRLLTADKQELSEFISQYPDADAQHMRQLIRNAGKETQQNKPAKSARVLFRYLTTVMTNSTDQN